MKLIPKAIALDTPYIMQIIGVKYERKPFLRGRDTFTFKVRIWPDRSKPNDFVEVTEKFYDGGYAEKFLKSFIEKSTGGVYEDLGASEMIGAAFWGSISSKSENGKNGGLTFYNLDAICHIDYAKVDDVESESMPQEGEQLWKG